MWLDKGMRGYKSECASKGKWTFLEKWRVPRTPGVKKGRKGLQGNSKTSWEWGWAWQTEILQGHENAIAECRDLHRFPSPRGGTAPNVGDLWLDKANSLPEYCEQMAEQTLGPRSPDYLIWHCSFSSLFLFQALRCVAEAFWPAMWDKKPLCNLEVLLAFQSSCKYSNRSHLLVPKFATLMSTKEKCLFWGMN